MTGVDIGAAADAELTAYLTGEGFTGPRLQRNRLDPAHGVTFEKGPVVLEVTLKHGHDYAYPGIVPDLGLRREDGILRFAGIWRLVPEGVPDPASWEWQYSDQSGLCVLLARFRDLVLRPHVAHYWRDEEDELARVVEQARRENAAARERDIVEGHLRDGRNHYLQRRFTAAIAAFAMAGELDQADRRKLDIARRWVARADRR